MVGAGRTRLEIKVLVKGLRFGILCVDQEGADAGNVRGLGSAQERILEKSGRSTRCSFALSHDCIGIKLESVPSNCSIWLQCVAQQFDFYVINNKIFERLLGALESPFFGLDSRGASKKGSVVQW